MTLLSLRPLRSPRSYAANDKRSLPQSAQSCGEEDMEPMRAQVLCFGASGRHSRFHHEASVWVSNFAFSASSARSAVTCCLQAVPTAERAELWGERVEPMRAQVFVP